MPLDQAASDEEKLAMGNKRRNPATMLAAIFLDADVYTRKHMDAKLKHSIANNCAC